MSHKHSIIQDIQEFLTKYGAWICYIGIGMVGKFGWDIVSKKKLSFWYIFGTGCMSAFVGYISSRWFINHNPEAGSYLVPILTLVSRDVMLFIKLIDIKKLLSIIFKIDIKD